MVRIVRPGTDQWEVIISELPVRLAHHRYFRSDNQRQYEMNRTSKSKRSRGGFIGCLCHFRALLFKMLFISIRKRTQTIAEILVAYIFIALLLGVRSILDRRKFNIYQMEPFNPQFTMVLNNSENRQTVYYPGLFRSCSYNLTWIFNPTVNPCTTTIVNNAVNELRRVDYFYPATGNLFFDFEWFSTQTFLSCTIAVVEFKLFYRDAEKFYTRFYHLQ